MYMHMNMSNTTIQSISLSLLIDGLLGVALVGGAALDVVAYLSSCCCIGIAAAHKLCSH